jgi:hypothetical protein
VQARVGATVQLFRVQLIVRFEIEKTQLHAVTKNGQPKLESTK